MKCKHYNKEDGGYSYDLNDKEELNLCEQCEMNLYADMCKQAAIEMKAQRYANANFEHSIEEYNKKKKK
jgi:hypothetical protein